MAKVDSSREDDMVHDRVAMEGDEEGITRGGAQAYTVIMVAPLMGLKVHGDGLGHAGSDDPSLVIMQTELRCGRG